MSDNPTLCSTCDEDLGIRATRFLKANDCYDPVCEACFARDFTNCPRCGEPTAKSDLLTVQTFAGSHWDPPEWDEGCERCLADRGEPDPDEDRDMWSDRVKGGW